MVYGLWFMVAQRKFWIGREAFFERKGRERKLTKKAKRKEIFEKEKIAGLYGHGTPCPYVIRGTHEIRV